MGDRMIDGPKLCVPELWLGLALVCLDMSSRSGMLVRPELKKGELFKCLGSKQMSASAPTVSRLTRVNRIEPFGRFGTIWSMKSRVSAAEQQDLQTLKVGRGDQIMSLCAHVRHQKDRQTPPEQLVRGHRPREQMLLLSLG